MRGGGGGEGVDDVIGFGGEVVIGAGTGWFGGRGWGCGVFRVSPLKFHLVSLGVNTISNILFYTRV